VTQKPWNKLTQIKEMPMKYENPEHNIAPERSP
jgi:hypothetical protein